MTQTKQQHDAACGKFLISLDGSQSEYWSGTHAV